MKKNKLVRDNIPNIIKENGEIPVTRILSEKEYREELHRKLLEESSELISAKTVDDILEEAADVFEVLKAIVELEGRDVQEMEATANQKRKVRGGFSKKVFLEKTMTKE